MSFFKNREWEGKTGPVWGVGTSGRRKDMRKVYESFCKFQYTLSKTVI
jgi:hypothetical protein